MSSIHGKDGLPSIHRDKNHHALTSFYPPATKGPLKCHIRAITRQSVHMTGVTTLAIRREWDADKEGLWIRKMVVIADFFQMKTLIHFLTITAIITFMLNCPDQENKVIQTLDSPNKQIPIMR